MSVFQLTMYAKAVWIENGQQYEGTIPDNWINLQAKTVRWPKKTVFSAHKNQLTPEDDWLTFQLVKRKMTSGIIFFPSPLNNLPVFFIAVFTIYILLFKCFAEKEQECDDYNYTSAQTDQEEIATLETSLKRLRKKRVYEGFVEGKC